MKWLENRHTRKTEEPAGSSKLGPDLSLTSPQIQQEDATCPDLEIGKASESAQHFGLGHNSNHAASKLHAKRLLSSQYQRHVCVCVRVQGEGPQGGGRGAAKGARWRELGAVF